MTKFYNAIRKRNIFEPGSAVPYKISRSKIDLFLNCQRCFYLDRRLGISQPPGPPFSLNSAVDKLLKKEFDLHRTKGTAHPLLKSYGLDLIPFDHPQMDAWRDSLGGGIQYLDPQTNLLITGGVDDVWVNPRTVTGVGVNKKGELHVVDYKATSKNGEVSLDADWQIGYKRQMEIYQWLFRRNGFTVNPTGYFVYANGDTDKEAFDGKLEFTVKIIPYDGDDSWVEEAIQDIHLCLSADKIPAASSECEFCAYREAAARAEK